MCFPAFRKPYLALILGVLPSIASASQLPARFTLGKYVPEHAWFFIHGVENPERAWIDQKWSEVIEAFKSSGIDRDLTTLVFSAMSEEDRTKAQATIEKVTNLVRGVRWSDLAKHELVFAEGVGPAQSGYGYMLLVRGAEKSGPANAAGLVAILKAVTEAAPAVQLVESKVNEVEVWTLRVGEEKPGSPGFALDLFRNGDIIGVAFDVPFGAPASVNRGTFDDVMDLMSDKPTKPSILANKRFQEALTQVPAPQDSLAFFDAKTFLGDLGRLFDRVGQLSKEQKDAQAKKEENGKESATPSEGEQAAGIARKVLGLVDFVDYSVTSVETQGRRELKHEAMRIQPGKESCALASACFLRRPFDRFDQFIPADATGFELTGFVDLGALYKLALDFVSESVPEGKSIVAKIQEALNTVGFDPQRDLFDWLSGEIISMELPAAVVTPMGGADSVIMIRVKNPQLAAQKVNGAIDFISAQMQAKGQMLMITPAKVNVEGFREITHPMFAMFARPVVGVQGDWLVISSSAAAVNKCLDVAAGKTASIKENARFKAEGLMPTGPVLAASFEDTSNYGTQLAGAAGMIGMVGGIAVSSIPDHDAESKQVKQMIQSALSIVMKLSPILQKIDFYSSESSITTYDGKLMTKTESVVTYKNGSSPDAVTAKTPVAPTAPQPPEAPKPPKK